MTTQLLKIEPYLGAGQTPEMAKEFLLQFTQGPTLSLGYKLARFHCPCAYCVDEHTGKRLIKEDSISDSIRPLGVTRVGRYAMSIQWNDGHKTGIYADETLHALALGYQRN